MFGIVTILSSLTYSQDSIRCFTLSQQKQILVKFVQLDECIELRQIDSLHIFDLKTSNTSLGQRLSESEKKSNRRKKIALFGIPTGFLTGILIGLKNN